MTDQIGKISTEAQPLEFDERPYCTALDPLQPATRLDDFDLVEGGQLSEARPEQQAERKANPNFQIDEGATLAGIPLYRRSAEGSQELEFYSDIEYFVRVDMSDDFQMPGFVPGTWVPNLDALVNPGLKFVSEVFNIDIHVLNYFNPTGLAKRDHFMVPVLPENLDDETLVVTWFKDQSSDPVAVALGLPSGSLAQYHGDLLFPETYSAEKARAFHLPISVEPDLPDETYFVSAFGAWSSDQMPRLSDEGKKKVESRLD